MDAMVGDAIGSGYATKTCETPARAVQISGPSGNGGLVGGAVQQHTLKSSIHCMGVGLHSGRKVSLGLHPAAAGTGIIFRRTDLGIDIPARFDHVVDTRLCTVLADPAHPTARIGTVEHVMAALAGCGVSNALVTLDGPEAPILDGSAAGFTFLIDCAGLRAQHADAPVIEIREGVIADIDEGLDAEPRIAFDAHHIEIEVTRKPSSTYHNPVLPTLRVAKADPRPLRPCSRRRASIPV